MNTLEKVFTNWRKARNLDEAHATNHTPAQLTQRLESMNAYHRSKTELSTDSLADTWKKRVEAAPSLLFTAEGKIRMSVFENFRRMDVFIPDSGPITDYSNWNPRYWAAPFLKNPIMGAIDIARQTFNGYTRHFNRILLEYFEILKKEGALDLLQKYDVSTSPGNPYAYRHQGHTFNVRWARHIYFINLLRRHLGKELSSRQKFVSLDLGSAYGVFSNLFKSEYPKTTHILVDFPDQLLLAAYYLGRAFPEARMATLADFSDKEVISREFIDQYDFVLVPVDWYKKLAAGSYDMLTNFVSFGEMSREWFDHYLDCESFKSAEFFFTSNRFVSGPRMDPTHNTGTSVRDYPLDDFETFLFDVNPLFTHYFVRKAFFFSERKPISSYLFDFIGRRKRS